MEYVDVEIVKAWLDGSYVQPDLFKNSLRKIVEHLQTEEEKVKAKYKIYFWFNLYSPNPFIKPSKEVEVEVEAGLSESEIILKGLRLIGLHPKTYSATVVKL